MYCDLLTVSPWGHPLPPIHADILNGWSIMGQVIKVFLLESCDGLFYEAESEIWYSLSRAGWAIF